MKRHTLAAALLACSVLAGPVEAWTITPKSGALGTSSAVVASSTYTAGSIVLLEGISRGSASGDVLTITGGLTGAVPSGQVYVCGAASANKTFQAWIYAVGGAETWTLTNSAGTVTTLFMAATQIDGAAAASAEDTGARNCATGQGTSPTINTTGTLAETGELVVGLLGRIGSSLGYVEDAAFGAVFAEAGNTNARAGSGYKEAPSTAAVTYHPTTTQSNNNIQVMAFKSLGGGGGSPARVNLPLLGVN